MQNKPFMLPVTFDRCTFATVRASLHHASEVPHPPPNRIPRIAGRLRGRIGIATLESPDALRRVLPRANARPKSSSTDRSQGRRGLGLAPDYCPHPRPLAREDLQGLPEPDFGGKRFQQALGRRRRSDRPRYGGSFPVDERPRLPSLRSGSRLLVPAYIVDVVDPEFDPGGGCLFHDFLGRQVRVSTHPRGLATRGFLRGAPLPCCGPPLRLVLTTPRQSRGRAVGLPGFRLGSSVGPRPHSIDVVLGKTDTHRLTSLDNRSGGHGARETSNKVGLALYLLGRLRHSRWRVSMDWGDPATTA
jgi:hypothetical protein